jgi:hypothetical protein
MYLELDFLPLSSFGRLNFQKGGGLGALLLACAPGHRQDCDRGDS